MMSVRVAAALTGVFASAACVADWNDSRLVDTQAELDALEGVEEIWGLTIIGAVSDLSPLSSLRSLHQLSVGDTTELTSLRGLENVRDPGDAETPAVLTVLLYGNARLADISALSMPRLRLLTLGGGNAALADAVLGPIEEVNGVSINDELTMVRFEMTSLRAIHGMLDVEGSPALCEVNLPALEELGELSVLGFPSCWSQEDQDALLAQTGQGG